MRETVQRLGVNSKRSQYVVGWEKKPRMFKLEKRGWGGGGREGGGRTRSLSSYLKGWKGRRALSGPTGQN